MNAQTLASGALAGLGIACCTVLAALGHPIPDVVSGATLAAVGGFYGAVHPRTTDSQDTPTGRHG